YPRFLRPFPTRRSSDLFCFTTTAGRAQKASCCDFCRVRDAAVRWSGSLLPPGAGGAPPHDGERMTATTDAVVVEGITKRYNSLTAVSDLSLRIRRGAIFGLLGPSGAGKTSTLRMIMRILIPDQGSIWILGQPLSDCTQDLIGYLPEERGLYPRMQVRKVLVFLAALKGVPETEA